MSGSKTHRTERIFDDPEDAILETVPGWSRDSGACASTVSTRPLRLVSRWDEPWRCYDPWDRVQTTYGPGRVVGYSVGLGEPRVKVKVLLDEPSGENG